MMSVRPQHVRTRLTLWYGAILAAGLLIYGGSSSTVLFFQLRGQLDRLAIEDLETVEGLLTFGANGKILLRNDYHDHPYPAKMQDRLMEVWGTDGSLLYRNEPLGTACLGGPAKTRRGRRLVFRAIHRVGRRHARSPCEQAPLAGGAPDNHSCRVQRKALMGPFLAACDRADCRVAACPGPGRFGWIFAGRATLGPLERMARRAHEINAKNLGTRLDVENPQDELGHLAAAFNETLGRIEGSFEQLRRFTSDASHELRTPLTAIRSVGEAGLRRPGTAETYREDIESMLEEAGRLTRVVESLLAISRADSGQIRLVRSEIDVLPFVREVGSFVEVLADDKGQRLHIEGNETTLTLGDRGIVRRF